MKNFSKLQIILCFLWSIISLLLSGLIIYEVEDAPWVIKLFFFSAVLSPAWVTLIWTWAEKDLKHINQYIFPSFLSFGIIGAYIFSHSYNEHLLTIPLLASSFLALLSFLFHRKHLIDFKNTLIKFTKGPLKKIILNKKSLSAILILFILSIANSIYEEQKTNKSRQAYLDSIERRKMALPPFNPSPTLKVVDTPPSYLKHEVKEAKKIDDIIKYFSGNHTKLQEAQLKGSLEGNLFNATVKISEVRPNRFGSLKLETSAQITAQIILGSNHSFPSVLRVNFTLPTETAKELQKNQHLNVIGLITEASLPSDYSKSLKLSRTQILSSK